MPILKALSAFLILAAATVSPATAEDLVPTSDAAVKLTFAPVAKHAGPAVVNVYSIKQRQQSASPLMDDPFFRQFFGGDFPAPQRGRPQASLGSGVIVDGSGLVVTNNHVIADGDEIKVALADRREFECDVVLKDEQLDLAVLRIRNPKGTLPAIDLSDSDELEVGDLVLAIGNPFGVGQTVTQGIVSALARSQVGISDYQFFIQTDAAINPGNSGGALVDVKGDLVGINTAIFTRGGGSNGIGFAIPSNMVKVVIDSARKGVSAVELPWIGADLQPVTSDIAESLGLDRPQGVLVTGVSEDSPAAEAGLEVGDLVTAVDGTEVSDPRVFNYRLATRGVGQSSDLTINRNGRTETVTVALKPPPETTRAPRSPSTRPRPSRARRSRTSRPRSPPASASPGAVRRGSSSPTSTAARRPPASVSRAATSSSPSTARR